MDRGEGGSKEGIFSPVKRHPIYSGWRCPAFFKEIELIKKLQKFHKCLLRNIDTALDRLLLSDFSITNSCEATKFQEI